MNIRLLYWYRARSSAESGRYCRRSTSSRRESVWLFTHSRSWRGSPERCETRSRGVISCVAGASAGGRRGGDVPRFQRARGEVVEAGHHIRRRFLFHREGEHRAALREEAADLVAVALPFEVRLAGNAEVVGGERRGVEDDVRQRPRPKPLRRNAHRRLRRPVDVELDRDRPPRRGDRAFVMLGERGNGDECEEKKAVVHAASFQNPPLMYFHCTILSLISRRRRLIIRQRRLRNCSDACGSIDRISFSVARSIDSTVASLSCALASALRGLSSIRAISPKKSPRSSTASASSPTPGMNFEMRTRPSRTM